MTRGVEKLLPKVVVTCNRVEARLLLLGEGHFSSRKVAHFNHENDPDKDNRMANCWAAALCDATSLTINWDDSIQHLSRNKITANINETSFNW